MEVLPRPEDDLKYRRSEIGHNRGHLSRLEINEPDGSNQVMFLGMVIVLRLLDRLADRHRIFSGESDSGS